MSSYMCPGLLCKFFPSKCTKMQSCDRLGSKLVTGQQGRELRLLPHADEVPQFLRALLSLLPAHGAKPANVMEMCKISAKLAAVI